MGRQWYEQPNGAKYLCKKNTFNDFVDVARWLIHDRALTVPQMLSCEGRSAGGMLIGATINQAPELFQVAIMAVPFVDVVPTMIDASLPLTSVEWKGENKLSPPKCFMLALVQSRRGVLLCRPNLCSLANALKQTNVSLLYIFCAFLVPLVSEWGNPNEVKYFDYMMAYSPVHNVVPGAKYPACLLTGGLYDPRVAYWEPAKMAATLRHHHNPELSGPVCLKIEMSAGHAGSSDRYKHLRELSFDYAFLLDQLGLANVSNVH